jgi:hypothetical protein
VIEGKLEGRIEMTGRRGKRRKQLLDDLKEEKILEIERGSTRSHRVETSLWKRLRTCRKTDYGMNEMKVEHYTGISSITLLNLNLGVRGR